MSGVLAWLSRVQSKCQQGCVSALFRLLAEIGLWWWRAEGLRFLLTVGQGHPPLLEAARPPGDALSLHGPSTAYMDPASFTARTWGQRLGHAQARVLHSEHACSVTHCSLWVRSKSRFLTQKGITPGTIYTSVTEPVFNFI